MEINLGNITVVYPNEKQGTDRKLNLFTDGDLLHINFIDDTLPVGGITLDLTQLELLSDTLNLIIKNKLIEPIED
jgi:hypothetical protein